MAKKTEEGQMTPLFQQYFGIKQAHPDCLVLMQCGDFYEAYGSDAEIFARDLDIVLTAKEAGLGRKIAMAGIPIHVLETYLRGLVAKGHRVAVAEQTKNPSECKGLVPREVTRIVTAGTVLDMQSLDEKNHNYLVCLCIDKNGKIGLSAADIGTGDFCGGEFDSLGERAAEEIMRFNPSEIVFAGEYENAGVKALEEMLKVQLGEISIVRQKRLMNANEGFELLCSYFKVNGLEGLGFAKGSIGVFALAELLHYIRLLALDHAIILDLPKLLTDRRCLVLDLTTRRNLELTETLLGRERRGSLLEAADETCTSMGARALKDLMLRPLCSLEEINMRHDICADFIAASDLRGKLREQLTGIVDIERLLARISYGTFNARELLGIGYSLERAPKIHQIIKALNSKGLKPLIDDLEEDMDDLLSLSELLKRAINPEAPLTLKEGNLIRTGFNAELDELRGLHASGRQWLSELEEREREATGIKNLKVKYTSVYGYYIEISKSSESLVPLHYKRSHSTKTSETYITPELKEYEVKILGAEDKIKKLEYNLFQDLRMQAAGKHRQLRRLAGTAARLDIYCSFAQTAADRMWVRPQMTSEKMLNIVNGRHPVVERYAEGFVPNSCTLEKDKHIIILTGPNMSGKSTWLRQCAQIAVLAQMGSFVPAESAVLPVFDRIFTRVGASDDLHLGRSTFMVEMSETANIINNSTEKSLVILDEIGRGTSTFDGLAIAQAVVEYLHDGPKPLTLFATHFHELTKLGRTLSGCRNFRVAVKELADEVVFMHKIVPGGADRSYGIYVAKLAGMPASLLSRAQVLLNNMERTHKKRTEAVKADVFDDLELFSSSEGD